MGKTYVLDRVAADLARGFTHPAIQRLSSLVAAYPNDLDLRRRLAAAHRRVGNRVQAGRWDYLTVGADSRDTRAFEQAFPSAMARLRQVRWPYRAGEAATEYARSRLTKLVAAAEAERPAWFGPGRAHPGPAGSGRSAPSGTTRRGTAPSGTAPGFGRTGRRQLAEVAVQWRRLGLPWRRPTLPVTISAMVSAPLVIVGLITVVEWIVQ